MKVVEYAKIVKILLKVLTVKDVRLDFTGHLEGFLPKKMLVNVAGVMDLIILAIVLIELEYVNVKSITNHLIVSLVLLVTLAFQNVKTAPVSYMVL